MRTALLAVWVLLVRSRCIELGLGGLITHEVVIGKGKASLYCPVERGPGNCDRVQERTMLGKNAVDKELKRGFGLSTKGARWERLRFSWKDISADVPTGLHVGAVAPLGPYKPKRRVADPNVRRGW